MKDLKQSVMGRKGRRHASRSRVPGHALRERKTIQGRREGEGMPRRANASRVKGPLATGSSSVLPGVGHVPYLPKNNGGHGRGATAPRRSGAGPCDPPSSGIAAGYATA